LVHEVKKTSNVDLASTAGIDAMVELMVNVFLPDNDPPGDSP
jgi:hypothetical protein